MTQTPQTLLTYITTSDGFARDNWHKTVTTLLKHREDFDRQRALSLVENNMADAAKEYAQRYSDKAQWPRLFPRDVRQRAAITALDILMTLA